MILPGGRVTTRIGFGCSGLNGGRDRRNSLALIEAALEAGIRHFDVAPSYGNGQAEAILGEALRGHRDAVTITTKFGIPRPRNATLIASLRGWLRPILGALPARWRERARRQTVGGSARTFEPAALRQSLSESLTALGTVHVDLLLMHEMRRGDCSAGLSDTLSELRAAGRVQALGVGSSRPDSQALCTEWPELFHVAQHEWSIADVEIVPLPGSLTITHRAIRNGLTAIGQLQETDPARLEAWSRIIDADLRDPEVLPLLLLGAALDQNRGGIVLASTSRPRRVASLARVANDEGLILKARALYELYGRVPRSGVGRFP
ncbi:aldo/keto reductase [Sphingomonas sp. IC081]|uniref:aldo/keto reductase n=1 Tax=Sphingomonas sp. IC081 TaxID=304378 RepID=UPI0021AECF80|nr:aldo/keto reductase [Sphingomonas sp. IC081]